MFIVVDEDEEGFLMANRKDRMRESNTGRGQGKMSYGHVPTGPLPSAETHLLPLSVAL